MAKEQFFYRETQGLLELLDTAAHRSGKSRGQAFEDFLELVICTLSGGQMEEAYLKVAQRYSEGKHGERGIDVLARTFGELVRIMEDTRADVLGDLYQGAITRGENGQFLTPITVTDLMAQLVGHDETGDGQRVLDCCCGSGRMLLSAAKVNPNRLFVGQDVDLRCVRMTAINLALRGLIGRVIWGNSLTLEQRLAYETGFNGAGFIREVPVEERPAAPMPVEATPKTVTDGEGEGAKRADMQEKEEERPEDGRPVQGLLF